VPGRGDRARGRGIALERERRAEDRDVDLALGKHAHQPPEAGPAAVLVDRLDDQVALARADRRARHFGEVHLRGSVAVGDRVLRSLFVVHDDLQREPRAVRPLRRAATGIRKGDRVAYLAPNTHALLEGSMRCRRSAPFSCRSTTA
jgi:hypothetical protein